LLFTGLKVFPSFFQTIKKNKQHLADNLSELGFISDKSPADPDANVNSENKMLLRAVLCAGLYPNAAKVHTLECVPGSLEELLEGLLSL
jgi:hypothetical protein